MVALVDHSDIGTEDEKILEINMNGLNEDDGDNFDYSSHKEEEITDEELDITDLNRVINEKFIQV